VGLAGLLHVVTELAFAEPVARAYNVVATLGFLVYLVLRARGTPGIARLWGMRRDNFVSALRAQSGFALVAAAAIVVYGLARGGLALPRSFWTTLALYPVWGIAQQFALQNLVARNLAGRFRSTWQLAAVSAAVFSAAHFPRMDLMTLALVAGFFFTWTYRRRPNVWAVGIVHGLLGSLAIYVLLGEDPGGTLTEMFFRHVAR
jgi:membrane protease YdiL (CAAX protease family)